MSEEMDILRDSYDGLISDEVRDAQLAALAPSPATPQTKEQQA